MWRICWAFKNEPCVVNNSLGIEQSDANTSEIHSDLGTNHLVDFD